MATRVPGISQAEFTLRETVVVDAVIRGLNRVATQQANRINATVIITAAAGDEPGPAGQPYISADDLVQITADWNLYTDDTLLPLMEQTYLGSSVSWTLAVAQTVPGWDADMIPAVSSLQAEDYLAGASNRLRGIGDQLWQAARAELLEGFTAGETIPELAARVSAAAGVSAPRATVIARTEVIGASNRGSWDTARLLGKDAPKKTWTATFDERTRPTHRDADNAYRKGGRPGPIPIDEPFLVGGYPLQYPGAPEGPIAEVASCRCTTTYVFDSGRPKRKAAAVTRPIPPTPQAANFDTDLKAFAARLQQGEADRVKLSGGMVAKTDLVTLEDGSKVVHKTAKAFEGVPARAQQDAEELVPFALRAFGLRAPIVHRAKANAIYMEHFEGRLGWRVGQRPAGGAQLEEIFASDEGRILGLVDALMSNDDRHGNWLLSADNKILPIDHGLAHLWVFGPRAVIEPEDSGFTRFLSERAKTLFKREGDGELGYWPYWIDNDLSPQDIATARLRLQSIRPEFERLNRLDWYENSLIRLDVIAQHAKGTKVRIT